MAPIIEVSHLSKEYRLGQQQLQGETFRELIARTVKAPVKALVQRGKRSEGDLDADGETRFLALDDVSFDVAEGEVVGIIGGNGAGKSTLLKILARITDPTKGVVHVRGRIASLLEVGTGFHPELTGRENVFLNGATLGMRRAEITANFDQIVAFAEVERFIDTPVKRYSSGMYVRLAFAVAAHLNPEILIVDEVLAVGDMAFQKKCLGKMSEVSRGGRTVLFVSHNMAAVENLCQRGVLLNKGKLVFDGAPRDAIQQYLAVNAGKVGASANEIEFEHAARRESPAGKLLQRAELFTDGDRPVLDGIQLGARLKIKIHFDLPRPAESFDVGIGFNNNYGARVFTANSYFEPNRHSGVRSGRQVLVCDIPSMTLVPGEYTTFLWLNIGNTRADEIGDAIPIIITEADYYGTGKVSWRGSFVLPQRWYLEPEAAPSNVIEAVQSAG